MGLSTQAHFMTLFHYFQAAKLKGKPSKSEFISVFFGGFFSSGAYINKDQGNFKFQISPGVSSPAMLFIHPRRFGVSSENIGHRELCLFNHLFNGTRLDLSCSFQSCNKIF